MSINSGATRKAGPFSGNGSTVSFPFTFKVFQASDLYVVLTNPSGVETVQTLTSQYSVSLNSNQDSNPGGSVVMVTAPASGYKLTLGSQVAQTQPLVLTNTGGFYPTVINDALDRATIQIQQLNEQVQRSAKLPISSTADANTLSADIVLVANDIANIDAVAGDLTNINSVAGNATNINTVAGSITNVNNVGGNIANVIAVDGNATNINAVKNNATNINTVAGINANVTTVAGISANVTTVAGNNANVTTVATNITSVNSAATNMAAIIAAPTQAANAAASAAAAAASAASGMYSAVQDKSADYTVVAADAGDLLRITTTGGARTITLPQISGTGIGDGFKIAVVKWTGDANAVIVARSGSDTINGATSYSIGNQYSSVTFVADFETNQWFAAASGLGTTNANVDVFSGNGSTTAFTLSGDPGNKNNTMVEVGGVYQNKSTYSVSGTTLTFSSAPPNGAAIEVNWNSPLAIGVPSDNTVSTAKIVDAAVTTAKIADANVTTAKIADNNVTYAKLAADVQGALYGFKNRLINGGMAVGQRGSTVFTGTNNLYGWVDRWLVSVAGTTVSALGYQATAQPTATGYSLQVGNVTTTGTTTVQVSQRIEAINCADLNGATVTFSGKVRQFSGATQTLNIGISKATAGVDNWGTQSVVASTTLSVPNNTWTNFSFTTTLGASDASNGLAVYLNYSGLSAQSNSQWYFGDCQLEKGSTATSFDYRPYTTELQLCQRYCTKFNYATAGTYGYFPVSGACDSTTTAQVTIQFPVAMRSSSTISLTTTGTASNYSLYTGGTIKALSVVPTLGAVAADVLSGQMTLQVASGLSVGYGINLIGTNSANPYLLFQAEL